MSPPKAPSIFRTRELVRRFDRAAAGFDNADFLHRRAFDGLMERLEPMQLEPRQILDLGSATGSGSLALAKTWRRARVLSVDLSRQMLGRGLAKRPWFSRIRAVQADAQALPFTDASVDMIVANLTLPWLADPERGLAEAARVLRREGLFAFATLGPDTLSELREAWRQSGSESPHVHPFADMHDIGDALVRAGFADPVLDVERLSITYAGPAELWRDLRAAGAGNALAARARGLTGRQRLRRVEEWLDAQAGGGRFGMTVELVFGHAWGAGRRQSPQEFRVDPGEIGRRPRNS